MKTKTLFKVIPVAFTLSSALAQTAAERLEQGVQLQQSDGDLDGAILEYKEVLRSTAKSKRLAAEARYRLAECFAAKGNNERMEAHLKTLREDFPADNKWVIKGNTLAPTKTQFGPPPWEDGQFFSYDIKIPDGKSVGQLLLGTRRLTEGPDETWETVTVRTAGGKSLSRTVFATEGYKPISARWYLDVFGDVSVKFDKGTHATIYNSESEEKKDEYDHLAGERASVPLIENEQMIQVMRSLNQKIGTKQKTTIIAAHNGAVPITFDLEVTGHEEIETKAGTFDCAKIENNIKQTFYISRGEKREIVRIDAGPVKIELAGEEQWDYTGSQEFASEPFGCHLSLPGVMFHSSEHSNEEKYSLLVWSTDFAGRDGQIEVNKKSNLMEEAKASSEAYAKVLHEGYAKNFDEFIVLDDQYDELEIDGVAAVGSRVKRTQGEKIDHEYQIHAVGSDLAVTFRMNYAKPDEARAIARAKLVMAGFKWSGE